MGKGVGVRPPPPHRWTKQKFPAGIHPDTLQVEAGYLDDPVEEGDPKFFGMSPTEFEYTDPQLRILLEVVWHALEDAGVDPSSLHGTKTGIFTGIWEEDYRMHLMMSGLSLKDGFRVYMGNSIGAIGGRLSHFLKTIGPNISTESGKITIHYGLVLRKCAYCQKHIPIIFRVFISYTHFGLSLGYRLGKGQLPSTILNFQVTSLVLLYRLFFFNGGCRIGYE